MNAISILLNIFCYTYTNTSVRTSFLSANIHKQQTYLYMLSLWRYSNGYGIKTYSNILAKQVVIYLWNRGIGPLTDCSTNALWTLFGLMDIEKGKFKY